MLWTLREALRLVDRWTRRRVAVSSVLSVVMALFESAAFALIYLVLDLVSNPGKSPSAYPLIGDLIGTHSRSTTLTILTVAGVGLFLTKSVSSAFVARWQSRIAAQAEARLAVSLFDTYLREDYLAHVARNSSVLVRNLTASVGTMCTNVIGSFTTATTDSSVLVAIFITLLVVSPVLTAALAGYLVAIVIGYLLVITPSIRRAGLADQEITEASLKTLQESFTGIKAVQSFDVMPNISGRYRDQRAGLARSRTTLTFAQRLPQYYLEVCLLVGVTLAAVLLLRGPSPSSKAAVLGILVGAVLRLLPSVNRLLGSMNAIRAGKPAVENLLRGLEEGPRRFAVAAAAPCPTLSRDLALDHVTFVYPHTIGPALADVTLTVRVGESVGVVGPSGSGKSTLVDVLLGLLSPTEGSVQVDGVTLQPAMYGSWRQQLGYIPQETFLLDASIRENIAFFRTLPEGDDAVWRALAGAQLDTFVRGLPQQLDSQVGERGTRMSGGQRQRLGIARALVQKPTVLLLDEATSALDGATEKAVADTVAALSGAVTTITIAHRLSTVRSCDRIVLLDGGVIVDEGPFEILNRRSEQFASMVRYATLEGLGNDVS